jgi:hypothetical protein
MIGRSNDNQTQSGNGKKFVEAANDTRVRIGLLGLVAGTLHNRGKLQPFNAADDRRMERAPRQAVPN